MQAIMWKDGLEPSTSNLSDSHSNQPDYIHMKKLD